MFMLRSYLNSIPYLLVLFLLSPWSPECSQNNYRLVLQLHFHLLDVVGLLRLVVRYVAQELVDFVVVGAVVGIGTFRFLQGLRSVGEISSASVLSHLLCLLQTPLNPSLLPLLPKDTDLSQSCSLAKVPHICCKSSKGCPDLPSQCMPGTSHSSSKALLQLLMPMMVLCLFQIQRGSNSTVNTPAPQS